MNQLDKCILKDCLDKVKACLFDGWPKGWFIIRIIGNRSRKKEPEVFYEEKK